MSGGIQTQVNGVQAPGVAGGFASSNPRFRTLSGPGGLVAGAAGVTIGFFAWLSVQSIDPDNAAQIVNSFGSGIPDGFVGLADSPAVITTYLADASMVINAGFPVPLYSSGEFWAVNNGAGQALVGQKAYASYVSGAVTFAAAGSPTTASATASPIAAGTAATFTGSITGNVLTTIGAVTNTIYPGAVVTGTGVASGTAIVKQLSGTTGGAGTYAVNIPEQAVVSASLTATPYVLDTTGGTVTGTVVQGSTIQSTSGTVTGTVVGAAVTVLNGIAAGKHVVATGGGTSLSGTVVLASNVETKWYARSSGGAGELIKISEIVQ